MTMYDDDQHREIVTALARPTEPRPARHSQSRGGSNWRADIQGLRGVAVLAVLVYHLWPSVMTGGFVGVDVFFVISGFVITVGLVRHPPETFHDLRAFWGRRIRRLLPASLLVILSSLVAVLVVVPETRWSSNAREAIASALYLENWQLATNAVDYLRSDDPPSAFQHFWSLSVEEQFYLVWPLLLFGVAVATTGAKRSRRVIAATAIIVLVMISFWYSVRLTAIMPSRAYFATPVRVWEFGFGGLLAFVVGARPGGVLTGRLMLRILGWGGLIAILAAAVIYDQATSFPSWRAAVPVIGCGAVIVAGCSPRVGGSSSLLSWRPLTLVGDISYPLYLWHWPLIVLVPYVRGGELNALDRPLIVVASVILATVTKRFVEDPIRQGNRWNVGIRPFRFAAVGMLAVVAASIGVLREVDVRRADARQQIAEAKADAGECFGAGSAALGVDRCPPIARDDIVPAAIWATEDRTTAYEDGCWEYPPFEGTASCFYGAHSAATSIALVGNSHAGHWLSTLQELMPQMDFNITTFMASGCNVTTTRVIWDPPEHGAGCLEWAERVSNEISTGRFDLVVTSAIHTRSPLASNDPEERYELAVAGHREVLESWASNDVNVLVIRDTPRAVGGSGPMPDCVAMNNDVAARCTGPRVEWLMPDPLFDAATDLGDDRVSTVDLTSHFCSSESCWGVIGGVIVFYDEHHLTHTYARTLAPYLAPALRYALDD
jgi:peptidoglycan/LPS O-acetylase OafA/YrhL